MKLLFSIAFVALSSLWMGCGAVVSPYDTDVGDARSAVEAASIDAWSPEDVALRDALVDHDASHHDSARLDADASRADSAVPPFYASLSLTYDDGAPYRDTSSRPRDPAWMAAAVLYSTVDEFISQPVTHGRCETYVFAHDPRLDLGSGEVIIAGRSIALTPLYEVNLFRTRFIDEQLSPDQEVRLRFTGAGAIGPFDVTSSVPHPTRYLSPRPPPMFQALTHPASRPLTLRFEPTNEKVFVRLESATLVSGRRIRIMSDCLFDGRSGEVTLPSELLSRYPIRTRPEDTYFLFAGVDTVRTAPVRIADREVQFMVRSLCFNFGLWLVP
jgi:hypothetical protein